MVLFNFSVACDISCSIDVAVMTQCFVLSPVLMTVTRMPDERFFSNEVRLVFHGSTDPVWSRFSAGQWKSFDWLRSVRGSVPEKDDIWWVHLLYLVGTYQMNSHLSALICTEMLKRNAADCSDSLELNLLGCSHIFLLWKQGRPNRLSKSTSSFRADRLSFWYELVQFHN